MRKKFGFTLAEIMIVMSLLGVIAVLTIPTLYYNKMKYEYSARLKNFYSRMDNAVSQMELEKGSFRDMTLPSTDREAYEWYMEYIDPYMGHKFIKNPYDDHPVVYFKDGSAIDGFYTSACLDITYNLNPKKSKGGWERYYFIFCFNDDLRVGCFNNKDTFFGTYGCNAYEVEKEGKTVKAQREDLINMCKQEEHWEWCSKLLQFDGWEFKSDYPRF